MRPDVTSTNETVTSRPRTLHFDSPAEDEADENIQMLADFINKGKRSSSDHAQYVDLPNTAPPDSGLFFVVINAISIKLHLIFVESSVFQNRIDKYGTT